MSYCSDQGQKDADGNYLLSSIMAKFRGKYFNFPFWVSNRVEAFSNHVIIRKFSSYTLRIGIWNVNSLYAPEKLGNIVLKMERLKVNILDGSDVR